MMADILINSIDNQLSILSDELDTLLNCSYKLQSCINIANYIKLIKISDALKNLETTIDNHFSQIISQVPDLTLKDCEDLIKILTVKDNINTVKKILKPYNATKRLASNLQPSESSKNLFSLLYKISLNSKDYIDDNSVDKEWLLNIIKDLEDCLVSFKSDYTKNLKDEILTYCKDKQIVFAINLLKLIKIVENTLETLTTVIKFMDISY